MRTAALGFLLGIVWLHQLSSLPAWQWSFSILVFSLLCYFLPRWRLLWFTGIGFFWASVIAHSLMTTQLDPDLEGQDLVVEGLISTLPEVSGHHVRFQLSHVTVERHENAAFPKNLLLSWYGAPPNLRAGERWRLQVRLKRPHGYMNPGGFDYEGRLFQQGIRARGYVQKARDINQRIAEASSAYLVNQVRQTLQERLAQVLEGRPMQGIVSALALGDRTQISDAQWNVLTRTGTSHLVAISGLHIGLVAGFVFFIVSRLWSISSRLVSVKPSRKIGAVAALVAAIAYAFLAGFSIPTQRALVMVAVVMLAVIVQRHTRSGHLLACALFLVLLLDPMAVMAPGFWLSFCAVAFILYGMVGRIGSEESRLTWLRQLGRVQWLVTLGLFPFLILLFQQASLVSPVANIIAVPWVSLISVPLILSGVVFLTIFPPLAHAMLDMGTTSLDGLWWILQSLSDWQYAQWYQSFPGPWTLLFAIAGIVWLLAPKGIPGRWVGLVFLLPAGFANPGNLAMGEAQFALLDVGEGLAAVVITRDHSLVFDAGPRFSSGFNAGRAVVAPYLRAKGVRHIDTLVVSHGDNDHIGGVRDVANLLPVTRTISSVPEKLGFLNASMCEAGDIWQWDGVRFEVLNPKEGVSPGRGRKGNNRSCVLRVQAGRDSVLLTADIERGAERQLIGLVPEKLRSSIMVVPHHGSNTSSTSAFIDVVSPRIALFPVGYRNRYRFPKPAVVTRFSSRHIRLLDSAHHGAIEFLLGGTEKLENTLSTWRQKGAHFWHDQFPETGPSQQKSL